MKFQNATRGGNSLKQNPRISSVPRRTSSSVSFHVWTVPGVFKTWKDTDHRRCRMRCGLEMPGFSIRIPLARSIRNSKMIYDLLYKTSPAFSVSVSARLRQICVTSGSAESAGSACQRAPPRLCPAGAPFLRSWSSACSCSCPARTERNKYFSYSSAFRYS